MKPSKYDYWDIIAHPITAADDIQNGIRVMI